MSIQSDIRSVITQASKFCGLPTDVVLKSGEVVQAVPGVSTQEDVALGGQTLSGHERTLLFVAADVPGLKANSTLTWNGQNYVVIYPQLKVNGLALKAFIQVRS